MAMTALFMASVDPMHIGHVSLLEYVLEHKIADVCRIIVLPNSPSRSKPGRVPLEHRIKMAELSVSHLGERVCVEKRDASEFAASQSHRKFVGIIGSDCCLRAVKTGKRPWLWENVDTWVVIPRHGDSLIADQSIQQAFRNFFGCQTKCIFPVNVPNQHTSSSLIRAAMTKHVTRDVLVERGLHPSVVDYIFDNTGLYGHHNMISEIAPDYKCEFRIAGKSHVVHVVAPDTKTMVAKFFSLKDRNLMKAELRESRMLAGCSATPIGSVDWFNTEWKSGVILFEDGGESLLRMIHRSPNDPETLAAAKAAGKALFRLHSQRFKVESAAATWFDHKSSCAAKIPDVDKMPALEMGPCLGDASIGNTVVCKNTGDIVWIDVGKFTPRGVIVYDWSQWISSVSHFAPTLSVRERTVIIDSFKAGYGKDPGHAREFQDYWSIRS